MSKIKQLYWAFAVMAVATLNIADVLLDWTTFAAILTLPFIAGGARGCAAGFRR